MPIITELNLSNKLFSHNLYITLLFALFVFLPDIVIKYFCHFPIKLEMLFCGGILLFGFLLSLTNKAVFIFFVSLIYIMKEIGWNLQNPNEKDGIYYLHGNNIDFPYDFIEYKIKNDNIYEIKKENTGNLIKN